MFEDIIIINIILLGPVLLMVGLLLFENTHKVDWEDLNESLTVFVIAIFSAFTYSIFNGVMFGVAIHLIMLVITGEANKPIKDVWIYGMSGLQLLLADNCQSSTDSFTVKNDDEKILCLEEFPGYQSVVS